MPKARLKNITLSAREDIIEIARKRASEQHTTLNHLFREWLEQFTNPASSSEDFYELMSRFKNVVPGRKFSREEANER